MLKVLLLAGASVYVVDGDTLRVDRLNYRLVGFNAAEIHAPCDEERRLALDAKAEMLRITKLPGATLEQVYCAGGKETDKYGRFCGKVTVNGVDAKVYMLENPEGFAEPYNCTKGGHCPKRKSWCPSKK
jgi:micrococcal nuclease